MELLLSATIDAAIESKAVKSHDLNRVTVDTTVQEKAIAFSDRLQALQPRPGAPGAAGESTRYATASELRASGSRLLFKNNRYGHARQLRRQRRTTSKLKTVLGRVYRDIDRRLAEQPESVQVAFVEPMALTNACSINNVTTKRNSTRCTHRRSNALPKARRTSATSSVSKPVSPPPTAATWWWEHNQCRVIHTMVIHSLPHWHRSND